LLVGVGVEFVLSVVFPDVILMPPFFIHNQ
jgi:hypothetical protein